MKAISNHNMLKGSKGRPQKHNNVVKVNELICEYIITKMNGYGKSVMYFKIMDSSFRSKMKPLYSLNDKGDLKLPLWEAENKDLLLKVGEQWYNNVTELVRGEMYVLDIEFKYYDMETENGNVKGYYAKIPNVKPFRSNFEIVMEAKEENEKTCVAV